MHNIVQYRVRPVMRYVVTRYHSEDDGAGRCSGGVDGFGEFDNLVMAQQTAQALVATEPGAVMALDLPPDQIGISPPAGVREWKDCGCPHAAVTKCHLEPVDLDTRPFTFPVGKNHCPRQTVGDGLKFGREVLHKTSP